METVSLDGVLSLSLSPFLPGSCLLVVSGRTTGSPALDLEALGSSVGMGEVRLRSSVCVLSLDPSPRPFAPLPAGPSFPSLVSVAVWVP